MSLRPQSAPQTAVSLRSVSVVTFFSVAQLVVLFLLQLVLAKIFGASAELDVFMAVQAVPLVLSAVLTGSLGSVLIPLASDLDQRHQSDAVNAVLNRVGWLFLGVSTGLAGVLTATAGPVTAFFFSGFTAAQLELGSELLRILGWLIPLNTMTGFFFAVFHTRQRFLLPAVSGLAGPAVTVAAVVAWPESGVRGVAWAVVAGGVAGVLMLVPGFPRSGSTGTIPLGDFLRRFAVRIWPLMLGAAYFRLDPLLDRHLLAGLSEGSISHLGYASRLMLAVATLTTGGLSVVAFPALARHAVASDQSVFASELSHAWRFLCVVVVPCVAGIVCFSDTLVAWFLQRGEFTPADTQAVARLMRLYAGVVLAAGIGEVSGRALFALGATRIPILIGMISFTLCAAAKFATTDQFGAEGLALLTSFNYLLSAVMFLLFLRWRVSGALFVGLTATALRTGLCTCLAFAGAWPVIQGNHGLYVPLGIACSVICYVTLQWWMKDEFVVRVGEGALRMLGRTPNPPDEAVQE